MAVPRSLIPIEADRAAAIFEEFATNASLAWQFPADGCYARTHVMVQRLLEHGLAPTKVWAFAGSKTDLLWIETACHPAGQVQWVYHVAPVLMVRVAGESLEMVFDPALFRRPVSVEAWVKVLHDTPTLVRSTPGEPPIPALGGSGYWPGPDPLEGVDTHAVETLEEYVQETHD